MNRRAVLLGAVLVIGVVGLWWVFLYSPKGKDLNDARRNLANARSESQTLNAELKQLQDLQRRSPGTEAQLGKLSAAIPASPNQADFISGLNDIADRSGLSWESVTMQEPTAATAGGPPTISVQIKIGGGFFQALDYLNRLEDLDRLVVVDSVTINSGSTSTGNTSSGSGSGLTSGSGNLSLTLNARIFSQSTLEGGTSAAPGGSSSSGSGSSGGSTNTTNGVTN